MIRNLRNDCALAHDIVAAFDSKTRRTGLLRHTSFPEGSAMLIAPSNAVHTFFMRFPIDILFATRDGRVVKASPNVPARRIVGTLRGFAVIELAAGELARSQTVAGDRIAVAE